MDHKDILKAAKKAGWSLEKRNNGHIKLTSPSGEIVFTSGTPSDWRATANLMAHLRRLGLDV